MPPISLVLGGVSSGKSAFAEALVHASGLEKVYLATAEARDAEMAQKIAAHRTARAGQGWRTVEAPVDLIPAIRGIDTGEAALLDCATLWLSNVMGGGGDWRRALAPILDALERARGPVVIVSNEIGLGGIAGDAATRAFQREHGEMNQVLGDLADFAALVVAGLPMVLVGDPPVEIE